MPGIEIVGYILLFLGVFGFTLCALIYMQERGLVLLSALWTHLKLSACIAYAFIVDSIIRLWSKTS